MLKYLIIQLDDTSVSYCHYENSKEHSKLIGLEDLKSAILFAMKENLMIQFLYPNYELPQEYKEVIHSIDHSKIVSSLCEDTMLLSNADVVVFDDWTGMDIYDFKNFVAEHLKNKGQKIYYLTIEAFNYYVKGE